MQRSSGESFLRDWDKNYSNLMVSEGPHLQNGAKWDVVEDLVIRTRKIFSICKTKFARSKNDAKIANISLETLRKMLQILLQAMSVTKMSRCWNGYHQ